MRNICYIIIFITVFALICFDNRKRIKTKQSQLPKTHQQVRKEKKKAVTANE